ncbi:MAG: signal peptide peptidase SppA [Alcanivoracaceae bacterium]|nr:signal peptide peptidase SppA [Alcanivoracaceae bacterium]
MDLNQGGRPQSDREWKLLEKLLLSVHDESRKQRRWTIFFRVVTFAYLFLLLFLLMPGRMSMPTPVSGEHVGVVDVSGVIADGADASADMIVTGLREAFEANDSKAVLLRINSPGGSPVQSAYVYREIMRLRDKHPNKPVYAVIVDVGASGAYYIAAAADYIYADQASIVGSIGVIMAGFGFTEAIDKLGVERRVMIAGNNKALLDPFTPVQADQQKHVQNMLDEIHGQFIEAVKQGRGERLTEGRDSEIFSGLFWTGERALELGLIDGLGSPGQVSRDVIGVHEMVDYTPRRHPLDDLLGRLGTSVGQSMANALGGMTVR